MKCSYCGHYKTGINYNACDIAEMECFHTLENCTLVNDDGTINYNDEYFKDIVKEEKVMEFVSFKKIPRLNREIIITEKIDGTNAQICITEEGDFLVGSRNRWITPEDDNAGFARWAHANKEELMKLGVGSHYGEWYGQGIQRKYGLTEKRFALFNTARWADDEVRPKCCGVVPILYQGVFAEYKIQECLDTLDEDGSYAVPGFMKPEGIVIYHTALGGYFKVTLENDEVPKSKAGGERDEI